MSDFGDFLGESGESSMKLEADGWPETLELKAFFKTSEYMPIDQARLKFQRWFGRDLYDRCGGDGRHPAKQVLEVLDKRRDERERAIEASIKAEAMKKVESVTAHIEQQGGCVSDEDSARMLKAFQEQGKTFALDATKPSHASIIHRLSQLAIENARLYYEAKLNEARQAANEARMNQVKLELDAALMEELGNGEQP